MFDKFVFFSSMKTVRGARGMDDMFGYDDPPIHDLLYMETFRDKLSSIIIKI